MAENRDVIIVWSYMYENAHIIFIGAVSERLKLPGLSAYAASKAGLEAFAEVLGKEERKKRHCFSTWRSCNTIMG